MGTTSASSGDATATGHVDVLIVGAGLSGIGAACYLQTEAPGLTYEIVESRTALGGTWDLFRYPGVRSDSDMFTLGYAFRPWQDASAIAAGGDILRYVRDTAAAYGVDRHITYRSRVESADWSADAARWTVLLRDPETGEQTQRTCGFLYVCSGYYRYDEGYTPDWPGRDAFGGTVVHPQHWPEDTDVTGKRVVVIGSGATAITLVPALAQTAARVTMVQRSPSFVFSLPTRDPVTDLLRRVLPERRAYAAVRWKNARLATGMYQMCRRYPARARALLRRGAAGRLPAGFDVDTHFNPAYDPWDQRMCMAPDGDFFDAISDGRADVVTDHVEAFTPAGVRLRSGMELEADVIVTATGLNLLPLGGIALTLDGEPVAVSERVAYKGVMLDGVPNAAFVLGYTNASWTLKVDLVCPYVAGLLRYMRERRLAVVTPRLPAGGLPTSPFIEMSSGYFERSRDSLPRQGDRAPWRLDQHYFHDAALFKEPFSARELEFRPAPALVRQPG
jgi:monooxygenase